MTTYRIMLGEDRTIELLTDDNAKASRPFDGGHICYAPESYPAKICDFEFGAPTYAEDADPLIAMPVSYPTEMLKYREMIVNNPDEWTAASRAYLAGNFGA